MSIASNETDSLDLLPALINSGACSLFALLVRFSPNLKRRSFDLDRDVFHNFLRLKMFSHCFIDIRFRVLAV